ncbi:MAG: DUF934 domain-containing protein [Endozoicomonas sp.]
MARLLKDNELTEYACSVLSPDSTRETLTGDVLVPQKIWLNDWELVDSIGKINGLLLEPDDEPEAIAEVIHQFPLIAVQFPKFMDGRGYSISRVLRDRYGYRGDIRAIGDVLIDQLFYMKRCGFSSFLLREDQNEQDAQAALTTFSSTYQGCSDDPEPLYRKRFSHIG